VDSRNVLTDFGFESVSFAGIRVNGLGTGNQVPILQPTRTLDGDFSLVFYPP
jgi:hypothetical protein